MPDPKKIKAIVDYPVPKTVKEIQAFMGMVNFYRRHVHKMSEISHPLTQLTRKSETWKWGEPEEHAFQSLKNCLIQQPILGYPDWSRSFYIYCDASMYGIGSILCQLQDPHNTGVESEEVIAYNSKHLLDREVNYSTVEKELYAIVHAVTVFRPYIYGRPFKIMSDHRPLSFLYGRKDATGRLGRWALKLQEYQMDIEYKPGKEQRADCLSRTPVPVVHAVFSDVEKWVEAQQRDENCREIRAQILGTDRRTSARLDASRRGKEEIRKPTSQKGMYKLLENGLVTTIDGRVFVPKEKIICVGLHVYRRDRSRQILYHMR